MATIEVEIYNQRIRDTLNKPLPLKPTIPSVSKFFPRDFGLSARGELTSASVMLSMITGDRRNQHLLIDKHLDILWRWYREGTVKPLPRCLRARYFGWKQTSLFGKGDDDGEVKV